ncbi:hypothetical protein EXS57_03855 [Candidatus Kaiserbacteria bacterium]|nr:hypothetical protein [Candidatus Kaiserbacteria bacterium]
MTISSLSSANRDRVKTLLELILDQFEMDGRIPLAGGTTISDAMIERAGLLLTEVPSLVRAVNADVELITMSRRGMIGAITVSGVEHPFVFGIIDEERLRALKDDATSPYVVFDPETGVGRGNGKRFQLRRDTGQHALFSELYAQTGKAITRKSVLTLIGFYKDGDKSAARSSETEMVNNTVKKLRRATRLTKEQLRQSGGDLILENPPV